jgi:hypothetical protein
MPIPFQSATWKKRSTIPVPINGGFYLTGNSVYQSSFEKASKVVQVACSLAHTNTRFYGSAMASINEGASWFSTYQGDGGPGTEFVVSTFSLVTPNGTYYYQVRAQFEHGFFVFDGRLERGGITLYASDFQDEEDGGSGGSFFPIQTLYTWPTIPADPVNTGGQALFNTMPSASDAIMIPGSGPAGEDAYWLAVSFSIDAGGSNNRQTINRADLWRSLDGLAWENVRDLTAVAPFSSQAPVPTFGAGFFVSTTGRIFLGNAYTNTHDADLVTTPWTLIGGLIPFMGRIIPMYGGTLSSYRNGSNVSEGFAMVSCDDGGNFFNPNNTPAIPVNAAALNLKLGPTEVIIICPGFSSPTTETVCWYSSDGGETWAGGEVWLASTIGERPNGMFLKSDGRPLVITTNSAFASSDTATGIATARIECPLANAGLARAKRLELCGGVITPDCKD